MNEQRFNEKAVLIRALHGANVCFARIYHRLEVIRPCRLPQSGPAILVCNHISGLDPALIQSLTPRVIVWMMAREYYQMRSLQWFFKLIGAIAVDRGGRDTAAIRQALRALDAGRVLGIFPEGRIEKTCELLPFQTGAAMLAVSRSVPVYPAYLDGSQRGNSVLQAYVKPQHARIAFGDPLDLSGFSTKDAELRAATNEIQQAVCQLRQIILRQTLEKNPKKYTNLARK